MNLIKRLWQKYSHLAAYAIFGVLTTLVNIAVYWLCAHPLSMSTVPATIVAWVAAVFFAYVTNRKWVFFSQENSVKGIILETIRFFAARLATGVLDVLIMYVFVDVLGINDLVIKVISNILVIILNYVASTLFVFTKQRRKSEKSDKDTNLPC